MLKMGFAAKWVSLVMSCVKLVSYSILINGSPVRNIQLTRAISPYLFILCAKALSALLHQAETKGIITGVPTSQFTQGS
jgi:hypothetical protein